MKKIFALLEELWVAVTFAEAGEYGALYLEKPRSWRREPAPLRAL